MLIFMVLKCSIEYFHLFSYIYI